MQHDVQHERCLGVPLSGFWQRKRTGNTTNSEEKRGPVGKTGVTKEFELIHQIWHCLQLVTSISSVQFSLIYT